MLLRYTSSPVVEKKAKIVSLYSLQRKQMSRAGRVYYFSYVSTGDALLFGRLDA